MPRTVPNSAQLHRARSEGFTLIEVAFVVTLILMVTAVGYPAFNQTVRKVRTEGHLQEVTSTLRLAQSEAVRRGVPVVAEPDPATNEIVVWANVDRDPALSFDPDPSATPRTTDYEVLRHEADSKAKIFFGSPNLKGSGSSKSSSSKGGGKKSGNDGGGNSSGPFDGLTTVDSGARAVVFEPNGSVRDIGALRLGDQWGNYFEVRVEPQATGRIQLLKYRADPPGGSAAGYYPRGTDSETGLPYWEWSTKHQATKK